MLRLLTLVFCFLPLLPGEEILWEARPGFRDFGRIAEADGVVVSGNVNGRGGTFAFNAATGKVLWRAPGHLRGGPVIAGNVAFSENSGSGTSAFDLKSGKVLWQAPEAQTADLVDLLLSEGVVFVIGNYGKMRALDAATGKLRYEHVFEPGGYLVTCLSTPVAAAGMVFYSGGDKLWALEAATGREIWSVPASRAFAGSRGGCVRSLATGGDVVAAVLDAALVVLDARTGAVRWRTAPAEHKDFSAPVIADGRVYVIHEGGLLGWSLADGRKEFEFLGNFPNANARRRMVFADGMVFFVANFEDPGEKRNRAGFLYGLDLATREVKFLHRVNRDQQYVQYWSTSNFIVQREHVYYENHSILVKVRR